MGRKTTALAIAAAIVLLGVLSGCTNSGEPRISVSPQQYDFGKIPSESVEHVFEVENTGGKLLEITQITTSCGCTTAEIDSKSIPPGETAKLVVKFDPKAMEELVQGKVERVVYIKSNDPEQGEIEIEITAFVEI